jgi:hypothetical protein
MITRVFELTRQVVADHSGEQGYYYGTLPQYWLDREICATMEV